MCVSPHLDVVRGGGARGGGGGAPKGLVQNLLMQIFTLKMQKRNFQKLFFCDLVTT